MGRGHGTQSLCPALLIRLSQEGRRDACPSSPTSPRALAEAPACPQSPRGGPPRARGLRGTGRGLCGQGSFPPVCRYLPAVSCLFPPHPTISTTSLKGPDSFLLIMRKRGVPAKGFPLPPPWGRRLKRVLYQTPSPRKETVVEFGVRSKGGRGSLAGSVRHDQVGLVCLCVFLLCFVSF